MKKISIAVDGPSAAGKSSIAKIVAKRLDYIYIDTGAMYRATGLYFLNNKIEINDKNIENNLEKINVDLKINSDGENEVYLNGENVTDKIKKECNNLL